MKKYFYIITIFLVFFINISKSDDHSDLIELADNGNPIAQNNLGHYYLYRSDNNPEYLDKAIQYLNAAAEQGQVNAMTTVGWTYFTGEYGAPKDNEQAIYWNQRASDLGCAIASYNMGFFYYSGFVGLEQDLSLAKKFWLLSASQFLDVKNICELTANELLIEINQYNINPTKEMKQLRDLFISLIKSLET